MLLKLSSVLFVVTMTILRHSTMMTAAAEHLRSNDAQTGNRKLADDPILVETAEGCHQFDDASLESSCVSLAVDANGDVVCHYCADGVHVSYHDPVFGEDVTEKHYCVDMKVECTAP